MRLLPRLLEPKTVAHAHCDLPCGIYDPAQARIEAESLKAIDEKFQQNTDPTFRTRCLIIKEQRSELVKHQCIAGEGHRDGSGVIGEAVQDGAQTGRECRAVARWRWCGGLPGRWTSSRGLSGSVARSAVARACPGICLRPQRRAVRRPRRSP
jgi:hypothetical protein